MNKDQVADILNEIAVLLELKGENPFKSRAYVNAARTIESLDEPLLKIVEENRLGELKGIGEALQKKIGELVATGGLDYYENLKASVPKGLLDLIAIPGLGPKKVKTLYDQLGIQDLDQLEAACQQNKIAELEGFGSKSQQKILEGIQFHKKYATRHLLVEAYQTAQSILAELRNQPDVIRCNFAGSLRRHMETIGDLDFLVSSKKPHQVIDYFAKLHGVDQVLAKGDTKSSVLLKSGIQADLRVVSEQEFPFALAYFTGSKAHNIAMRQRAIKRGLLLNEYGLFKSDGKSEVSKSAIECQSEEDIFARLGLSYIPPELREDLGEFDASEQGKLPELIECKDLRGSLHNHSTWSDGHQTLQEIAVDMKLRGFEYWAITDHSKSSFQAHGLTPDRLRKQLKEIEEINRRLEGEGHAFRLLTGTEVDILPSGELDFKDDLLAELDVVVASVHQSFSQTESVMTNRIIRAAQNPHVHILGHLTGRLLLQREAYLVNQHAVIEACAETGTWIELNANPYRLDMDWRLWPFAKKLGVKCVINTDAHRLEHVDYLGFGAGIARKGWLEKKDVMNTLPIGKLKKRLEDKRAGQDSPGKEK